MADLVNTCLTRAIGDSVCVKTIEVGPGGAIYLPYMVLHHSCLVNTQGNVNFFRTRGLVRP